MTTLKLSELLRYRLNMDNQQAPAGGYVHRQNVPSAFWTVNHGLGQKYVVVEVIRNDNLTNTGRYNYPVIDFADSNTLTVAFDYLATGVIVVAAGSVKGDKGEPGNITVSGSYVHDQPDPDSIWNIQHNLGHKYVSVEIIDEFDTVITGRYDHPTITYIDENNIMAAFDFNAAGKAVVSIGGGANVSIDSGANVFLGNANLTVGAVGNIFQFYTGGYGNSNVLSYLNSEKITSANIGAFQTYANLTFSTQANAATQAVELNSLRANITAANAVITSLSSNAAAQATLLDTLTGNAVAQSQSLDQLNSNAATVSFSLSVLLSNASAQQTSLTDLVANAAAQAQAIANVSVGGGTYGNANVATYLPTYTGNIAGNIVKNGYAWTFGTDGNLTIPAGGTITAPNDTAFQLQAKDIDSLLRNEIRIDPNNGTYMSVWSGELDASFSTSDWATGSWVNDGGIGLATFTVAENLQDFWTTGVGSFVNSVEVSINGGARTPVQYDGNNGQQFGVALFTDAFPGTTTSITSLTFYYRTQSKIEIDYDGGEILLDGQALNINLQTTNGLNLQSGQTLDIKNIGQQPVRIFTDNTTHQWEFDSGGSLTLPREGRISGIGDGGPAGDRYGYISWAGNTSGDGSGFNTMRLVPDLQGLEDLDQYIIIDPTGGVPGHIHIRAGGTQDNSLADLYLGGEHSHVKISAGANPPVTVMADDNSWIFGANANLTLPAGGTITEGGGLTGAIRLTPAGGANANQALVIYPTAGADGDHVHLTAGGGSTELYLGNDFHYVKLVDGGNIELRATTANLSPQASWTFDTTGNIDARQVLGIKVPNGVPTNVAVINSTTGSWEANPRSNLATTGGSGSGLTVNVTETGGYASTIAIATAGTGYNNGDLITVTSGTSNATFTIVIGGRNTWQFGTDGALTLPASSGQIGRSGYPNGIDLYNNNGGPGYVRMNYADQSAVWADSGGAHVQTAGANTWDFGTDANLTLPETGYLRVGSGIVAGFASSPAPIISGFSSISAENFKFQGNGVNILSTVGAGAYGNTQVASYLLNFDGDIEFTSSTAKIGNVDVITVGDHIRSPAYQFSNGVSILSGVVSKTTGSWTVTTGTNTYSIQLAENGTYQIWVDCNIPNGILAYNATATVTNGNVPVVGVQYAWVYNGGGTPIDFVSIPNQFIGTANTIVRSSVAPSATTNRFDFGINNTSGGNVTVRYGYAKIS